MADELNVEEVPAVPDEITDNQEDNVTEITQEIEPEAPEKKRWGALDETVVSILNGKTENIPVQLSLEDVESELTDIFQEVRSRVAVKGTQNQYSCHPTRNTHVATLARAFTSYLSLIDQSRLDQLYSEVVEEVTVWMGKLFNFENSLACYHNHYWNGVVKVCRLALRLKYPKYSTDGFTALYTRPPVIYISAASHPGISGYLRMKLGLPQSSICEVPCNTMFGSMHTMDIAAFERLLSDDISCGKTPLLVVAHAGTPLVGHTDNLQRLRELSTQNGLWFHVLGDALAALALTTVPSSIAPALNSDSITLMPNRWLQLPSTHCCTLYRTKDASEAAQAGLGCTEQDVETLILPLWMACKVIGVDELRNSIIKASELAQHMCHLLDLLPNIRRIEQTRCVSPVVVFRYSGERSESGSASSEGGSSSEEGDEESQDDKDNKKEKSPKKEKTSSVLVDSFNKMLVASLAQEAPHVTIDQVHITNVGWSLRFNPLVSGALSETTNDAIDDFIKCLEAKISAFDATLTDRIGLYAAVESKPDMVLVELPDFPGVGAVQCIPQYWKSKDLTQLSSAKQQEIDELNVDVLHKLSDKAVFSKGESPEGRVCIKIGLVNRTVSVQELLDHLEKTVQEVQESTKFFDKMAEVIRKGIEAAEHDLVQDSNDILMEEGILRQVPIVSSVFNWLSPMSHERKIKGRTFDLSSGSLHTTEKTYKYHMQLQDAEEEQETNQQPQEPPSDN